MNILISNDDGINALGLKILSQELAKKHDVYIIAPDREQSAKSHSLTIHSPLRVKEFDNKDFGAKKIWTVTGTPADCVKIGISTILENSQKPDIVLSGINHGPNLGHDVRYSGTVSAAIEGSMLGYNSIAVSLASINIDPNDFIYPAKFISSFIDSFTQYETGVTLNINFPKGNEETIKDIAITKLAKRIFTSEYEKRVDPQGREYYWLAGVLAGDLQNELTDLEAIRNNIISITPIYYDMTSMESIQKLSNILQKQTIA